jgi:hypothetical protein
MPGIPRRPVYRRGPMLRFAVSLCLGLTAAPRAAPFSAASSLPSATRVEKAEDWTALLRRDSGWTGADGIFAIPLSGYEGPDRSGGEKTLFVFSDTFIGTVDPATGARRGATMINNSLAILDGDKPDPAKIRFRYGKTAQGGPASAFIPALPSTTGKQAWYWLQDGFAHDGFIYDLPILVVRDTAGPPGFQFQVSGVALLKIPIGADGEPDLAHTVQMETPLYHKGGKTVYFGCGIFVNTRKAGAPAPDDSVYVYGRDGLYVARVQIDEFEDFAKWRYWDGKGWNADIGQSASLGEGGPELSVMAISSGALAGKYLLTAMGLENKLFVRIGDGPAGPFGARIDIFTTPEWNAADSVYTYNAKAHPSLSRDGNWLVTYNVNTSSWARNLADADIYRPRFLWMRFDPEAAIRNPARGRTGPDAARVWEGWGMMGFEAGAGAGTGAGNGVRHAADGRVWTWPGPVSAPVLSPR